MGERRSQSKTAKKQQMIKSLLHQGLMMALKFMQGVYMYVDMLMM